MVRSIFKALQPLNVALALLARQFHARGIRVESQIARERTLWTQDPSNAVPTLLLSRADRDARRPVRRIHQPPQP